MNSKLFIGLGIVFLLLNGCKDPHLVQGTSEYKAQQEYLASKEARLKREAAGNYTGYPVGSAEYIERNASDYDAKREKRIKELQAEADAKWEAGGEKRAEVRRQQAYYEQEQRKTNSNKSKYTNKYKSDWSSFSAPKTGGVDRVTSFGNGMYSYESGGDNISFKPASF